MPGSVVETSRHGAILTLRIDRPERENRLNIAVLGALRAGLAAAEADPAVRAVALTGTGATFCCGGDVAEFAAGDAAAYREFGERFAGVHLDIARLSKPVLAAVNGDARAGGISLLSICDLAVARESARFAMPEIRSGLWPVMAMVALNRALPRKIAFELYYFAEEFGAGRARDLGLVNWVVPDGEFESAVRERAERLAALPPRAVAIGRRAFQGIAERSLEDGYAFSARELVQLLTDPETVNALSREGGKR